jgi:hypothetical protein
MTFLVAVACSLVFIAVLVGGGHLLYRRSHWKRWEDEFTDPVGRVDGEASPSDRHHGNTA